MRRSFDCQKATPLSVGWPILEQLRQLGKVGRNPARFVAGQEIARCTPAGLLLEIDVGKRLAAVVADNEATPVEFFDIPRRREAPLLYRHMTPSSLSTSSSAVATAGKRENWLGFFILTKRPVRRITAR
jgi:hypothetical protein